MGQLYDITFERLEAELSAAGLAPVHAREVWRGLYRGLEPAFAPAVKAWLGSDWADLPVKVVRTNKSSDGQTRKLLVRLADGAEIETVVMGYPGRFTVCVRAHARSVRVVGGASDVAADCIAAVTAV
jgi:23S rRNA (adenine2503-C2)-methyltransferase